jgi:poly-gamma-glutamate synthesis protein (capsule biosynthesis protein)
VTLVAVGDILMHQDVKLAALQNGGFEALWGEVVPLFHQADLVFGNLETPMAPITGQPGKPYLFNAPAELADALRHSGFTLLSTANNHAYDQGLLSAVETLSQLEAAGLVPIGSGRDREKAGTPLILACNGIRFAFLAWTDLFNRQLNRKGKGPWINALDLDEACEAVQRVRPQVDVVIASIHWGKEDQHDPTPRQRKAAARLLEAGVDVILGHHPHVLSPLEVGETGGRKVAVAYSLGNFISNQNRIYDPERMPPAAGDERDSAALVATFAREGDRVTLEKIGYTPLWTENNWYEVGRKKDQPREIHVVRLDDPARQTAPWLQRRERIRAILGAGSELGPEGPTSSP